jgi:hypothetical protein
MMNKNSELEHNIWKVSMIIAPVLVAIAQFYWENGLVTSTAGWLQVLAFAFWIVAFKGLLNYTKPKLPIFSAVGFLIVVYAMIGGAGFGYDGIYTEAMGITTHEESKALASEIGMPLIFSLFIPGALFPLCIIAIGIALIRIKSVKPWIGILFIIAGISFPLGRIPRIDLFAHASNILLILSHVMILSTIKKEEK